MGPSIGKLPRLRFRLGSWMLLNIYLAIVLASVVLVARVEGRLAFLLTLVGVTTGVPWILYLLTMLLLRPSPRRDALLIVFRWLFGIASLVWITLWMTLFHEASRTKGPLGPGWNLRRSPVFWFCSVLSGLALLVQASAIFERRCPTCRWWCLVQPQLGRRETRRRVLLFEFVWCLACGARWKRNRKAPSWADASDPAYDEHFGLGPSATTRRRLADAWKERL